MSDYPVTYYYYSVSGVFKEAIGAEDGRVECFSPFEGSFGVVVGDYERFR